MHLELQWELSYREREGAVKERLSPHKKNYKQIADSLRQSCTVNNRAASIEGDNILLYLAVENNCLEVTRQEGKNVVLDPATFEWNQLHTVCTAAFIGLPCHNDAQLNLELTTDTWVAR